ncbi:hypothetical protein RNZ50_12680 [Paracoccaceae bacterium Fryx2]|nr:hypothetical protein [Paracoccaceae bacterium Fryx2]
MSNRTTLILAGLILGCVALDAMAFGGQGFLFLARKMTELVEYLAFWR